MLNIERIEDGYREIPAATVGIEGHVLVLSGVSAAGKSVLSDLLLAREPIGIVRNFTTRPPRAEDGDAERYVFGDDTAFDAAVSKGEFLCGIRWGGNGRRYALPRIELSRIKFGEWALYACTHFGAIVKAQAPARVLHVWLVCSSESELRDRLARRNLHGRDEIDRRLDTAVAEQRFALENGSTLIAAGAVDAVLDTSGITPQSIASEILRLKADLKSRSAA